MALPYFLRRWRGPDARFPRVAILTPIKDIQDQAKSYFRRLRGLTFPHENLSIRLLESDSRDQTFAAFRRQAGRVRFTFRSVEIFQRDFDYHIPEGVSRCEPRIQVERRSVLARSRNHLLFCGLGDADYVLWLDADVIEFPPDLVERLLAFGKEIVHPHCVKSYGGFTFDTNGWSHAGTKFLHHHRGGPDLVELTAVGGTVLLVQADCHRNGLIFPPFLYQGGASLSRPSNGMSEHRGEIETEGFGLMASDMGLTCWGAPHLEVRHRDA